MFEPDNAAVETEAILDSVLHQLKEADPDAIQSCLVDDQANYLSADIVEQYFESVRSPCFGRTTPLLYEEDGGASADGGGYLQPTTSSNAREAEVCPDFKQLGVMPTLDEDVGMVRLTSDDKMSVTGANKIENDTILSGPRAEKSSVNEKLRRTIQTRRRNSGLAETKVEWKNPEPEVLSEKDQLRLERRRESNRKAAAKSRIKKREEDEKKKRMMEELITENKMLKQRLEQQQERIRRHMTLCPMGASLRDVQFDVR